MPEHDVLSEAERAEAMTDQKRDITDRLRACIEEWRGIDPHPCPHSTLVDSLATIEGLREKVLRLERAIEAAIPHGSVENDDYAAAVKWLGDDWAKMMMAGPESPITFIDGDTERQIEWEDGDEVSFYTVVEGDDPTYSDLREKVGELESALALINVAAVREVSRLHDIAHKGNQHGWGPYGSIGIAAIAHINLAAKHAGLFVPETVLDEMRTATLPTPPEGPDPDCASCDGKGVNADPYQDFDFEGDGSPCPQCWLKKESVDGRSEATE